MKFSIRKTVVYNVIAIGLTYLIALLWHGYFFGRGDQAEIFPSVFQQIGKYTFENDFLLSWVVDNMDFTVRTPIVHLLSIFGDHLYEWSFFLHLFSSFFLFLGAIKLSNAWGLNAPLSRLVPLFGVVVFYGFMPGGNSLYDALFIAANIAHTLGLWAILFFIRKRYYSVLVCLAIAALFQPLVAFQVTILGGFATTFSNWVNWKKWIIPFSVLIASMLAVYIAVNQQYSSMSIEENYFFQVFFRFRNPHHYLPEYFSIKKILLAGILISSILLIDIKTRGFAWWFVLLIFIGLVFYSFLVSYFELTLVAKTQWYKTCIWLPVVAIITLLKKLPLKINNLHVFAGLGLCLLSIVVVKNMKPKSFYSIDTKSSINNLDVVIFSKKCQPFLDSNSLVIQPYTETMFQIQSGAPLFVSFKALVHHPGFIYEWAKRIQLVYGLDPSTEKEGFKLKDRANQYYYNIDSDRINYWLEQSISHMISTKPLDNLGLELVCKGQGYYLYRLGVTWVFD